MSCTVLLADDHRLVRAGIRALLDALPNVTVVGEAADGQQAIELVRELRPQIVLMDIAMPIVSGLDATAQLRHEIPETRVIILSMHATGDYVEQAVRSGASGYMLKDAATAELALAIEAVAANGRWISPAVSNLVIDRYLEGEKRVAADPLTSRQTEILILIAEGLATKEIAFRLGVSAKTVESHRSQLMERLGIRDVAGLVRYAIRAGLISGK